LRRTSARRRGPRGAPAPPAPAARHPRHLDLGAGLAVAADAREVAAGRVKAAAVGHRHLEALHVGLERLDALHVLVLAEGGLDDAPDGGQVVAGREQERDRAVAQLELARDRLGRAVHHPLHVVEPVAHVEGHHALALGIDAATARPPRHLGQLVVGQAAEAAIGALGQRLQHHALGRHVDAERHRLGGEDHLAQAPLEEQLDEALHGGQDARVVEPHPHAERLEDGLVERRLRDGRVIGDLLADRLVHLALLLAREQRLALGQDRLHGSLAARAAEDEVDGGQPAAALQLVEHHGGIHHPARVPAPAVVVAAVALLAEQTHLAVTDRVVGVDLAGEIGDQVLQRHRPVRMGDGHDRPVHQADPVRDLVHVAHGGGQRDQGHVLRAVDDDLLPHRPPPLVAHVVALVEHHRVEALEPARVEHVAQDLGGHHHHRRAGVHLDVPGEDAHLLGPPLTDEIGVLLVGERLERSGVGDAPAAVERGVDGELRHQGLARAGRRGHDHRLAVEDGRDGPELEVVERKLVAGLERLEELLCHGHGTSLARALTVPRPCATAKPRVGSGP
jgi:hypothetical protein